VTYTELLSKRTAASDRKDRFSWHIKYSVSTSSSVLQTKLIKMWKDAIMTFFKILGYFCLEELEKSRSSVPRLKVSETKSEPGTSRTSNMNVKL